MIRLVYRNRPTVIIGEKPDREPDQVRGFDLVRGPDGRFVPRDEASEEEE